MIEINLNALFTAVGIDIMLGALALMYAVRSNRGTRIRLDRVEKHLQLPPLEAVKE